MKIDITVKAKNDNNDYIARFDVDQLNISKDDLAFMSMVECAIQGLNAPVEEVSATIKVKGI